MDQLKQALEAVLFTSDDPLPLHKLKDVVDAKPEEIKEALAALKADYDATGRAFALEEIAGGYQLLTRPQHADIIAKLKKAKADRKLSAAALETLAIIAYKQPIKRVDLEAIRGAASGELIRALMERNLVKIAGREEVPGSPLQYGTTKDFLDTFGLKALEDLPRPEEVK
ncbi:MAG TPA: SMC-Scp complex subunit ScpB [Planctomycetota bacterium]